MYLNLYFLYGQASYRRSLRIFEGSFEWYYWQNLNKTSTTFMFSKRGKGKGSWLVVGWRFRFSMSRGHSMFHFCSYFFNKHFIVNLIQLIGEKFFHEINFMSWGRYLNKEIKGFYFYFCLGILHQRAYYLYYFFQRIFYHFIFI